MSNVAELREQISLFDLAYEQGNPLISDTEYEQKHSQLKKMEESLGEVPPDSPTQTIPFVKVDGLTTVKHSKPMLSLDKVKIDDEDDMKKFRNWYITDEQVLIQPKLDGITVILKFDENGELVDAITRGDGYEGQRILHLARAIKNLPQKISYRKPLEVRGEMYTPFKTFREFNENSKGLKFVNPRAMVIGTARLLDANIAAERGPEVQIFDLVASGENFKTNFEQLMFLFKLGFPVVATKIKSDFDKILGYCDHYGKEVRKTLPYPIDGAVVKLNRLELYGRTTSKFPLHAMAVKFESEEEFTTLREVQWQIGKNGQLTPVGSYDLIHVGGVALQKATLHNYNFILEQNIGIGSRILVARANDVIPKVVKGVSIGDEKILVPIVCPVCSAPVKLDGANAYCTGGTNCSGQMIAKIVHFCSRNALNIQGMGEETVKTLYNLGFIKTPADLYTLQDMSEQIKFLDGYGEKKVQNLLEGIEVSKQMPYEKVLYAINIPFLGKSNAKALAEEFTDIDTLMAVSEAQLSSIEGIGNTIARIVKEFFENEDNVNLINSLKAHGLTFAGETKASVSEDAPLKDLVFVITGTLSKPRQYFENLIIANGGKHTGSVSQKKTSYLILGPDKSGTSKHKQAQKFGIPIISEEALWEMVGGNNE